MNLKRLSNALKDLDAYASLSDSHGEASLELILVDIVLRPDSFSPDTRRRLNKIAHQISASHQDKWLYRFLRSQYSSRANHLLLLAIQSNQEGDPQHAQATAEAARRLFAKIHNSAGVARSEYEALYALHRQGLSHECESQANLQQNALQLVEYRWLRIQTLIEGSICASMANHFDIAARWIEIALREASTYQYGALELRALGMKASMHTAEGMLRSSWALNWQGLKLFWKGNYPPERGFQFYSDMELVAEKSGMWTIAVALQREAIRMLEKTNRHDFLAMAYLHMAGLHEVTGDAREARNEFDHSHKLFEQLPRDSATRLYLEVPEIELAELEANQGLIDLARTRIQGLRLNGQLKNNFLIRLAIEKTRAAIEHRLGNLTLERLHLQNAVAIGNKGFRTLSSPAQRWDWRREVGAAYRRLLDIEISTSGRPWQSFADWQSYRLRELMGRTPFGSVVINNSRIRHAVKERARQLSRSSFLSFAFFSDHLVAWVVDNRGVSERVIPISARSVQKLAQDFRSSCSDPGIPMAKVNSEGLRLYKLLLAPLARELAPNRTLFVEGDGALSQIPWSAVSTPTGQYLGQVFAIVDATGLFPVGPDLHHGSMGKMLVFEPGAVTIDGHAYPALPQATKEADFIARLYPNSTLLVHGRATTVSALRKLLPAASSFHFAGHAVSHPDGGELLLHGNTGDVGFTSVELEGLDLSKLKLAVLSACSTGSSEDPGRDPHGLVRAFLTAGTHRVLATSWDVDSNSAQEYMAYFYEFLKQGNTVDSAALRTRKLLLKKRAFAHPYFWAAFQDFGAPN